MTTGAKILAGLKDAINGDFRRVEIDGQTWVRLDPGYAIVPKEPTEEMCEAGDYLCTRRCQLGSQMDDIWRAMVAAAR